MKVKNGQVAGETRILYAFSNERQNVTECRCWIFRKVAFFYGLLITQVVMMGKGLEMRMIRGVVESVNMPALGALLPVIRIFTRRAEPHIKEGTIDEGNA